MKQTKTELTTVVETVEQVIGEVQQGIEKEIQPIRKSILKRFPTLFLLAVTFGVSLVFYSIEVILSQCAFVVDHPWMALGIGLMILIITGTLYRKLD